MANGESPRVDRPPALRWQWFGASVRGPLHRREAMPNQDCWLGGRLGNGGFVVVCDGMGSRPEARFGSQQACRAVAQALRLWSRSADAPIELLLRLVHNIWSVLIHPRDQRDCATTCLLAATCPGGRLVVAQLGDGLALVRKADGEPVVLFDRDDGFANQTTALGVATSLREWRCHIDPSTGSGTAVLLATDGIADDLLFEKRPAFLSFLLDEFASLPASRRWRKLADELRNWPVPRHTDDKTLALLWTSEAVSAP